MGYIRDEMSKKRSKKPTDLNAQLRKFVKEAGLTGYALSRDAGIDRSVAIRFLSGKRGLNLRTASKVCDLLGLELRRRRRG